MIIKTHIKLILNMYTLFSNFYWRERETICDGELKNTTQNVWTQNTKLREYQTKNEYKNLENILTKLYFGFIRFGVIFFSSSSQALSLSLIKFRE